MGLDSVELLYSIELFFDLQFSNQEAEKIRTIQDMVDSICMKLNIFDQSTTLKHELFKKLEAFLMDERLIESSLSMDELIYVRFDFENISFIDKLTKAIGLQIPIPGKSTDNAIIKFLTSLSKPTYDLNKITLDHFITSCCAVNYATLVESSKIKSTYEVLIVVIGITTDRLGLDVYEVQPSKSFVDDLGIS